jgi:hypothetical protein
MSFNFINKVPYTKGHSHFYDEITDFPALHEHHDHHHGHEKLSRKEQLLDNLRKDLIEATVNPSLVQNKLCYRSCFKLMDRDYTSFCLQKKCNQPDIYEAAKLLKLLK